MDYALGFISLVLPDSTLLWGVSYPEFYKLPVSVSTVDSNGAARYFAGLATWTATAPTLLGDINGDNTVNVADAVTSIKVAVGLIIPTEIQKVVGDMNQDGQLDVADAVAILRKAVGL